VADTYVTRMDPDAGRRLREDLGREPFQFRSVPHAHWSARGDGVVVTHYRSGKLLVQGPGMRAFVERRLGLRPPEEGATPSALVAESIDVPTAGSDESGKGDYFGPLTVAAVLVRPRDVVLLESLGVTDSKLASEGRIRSAEGLLMQALPHAVRVLMPEEYNAAHARERNVNVILGRLHAEVLERVLEGVAAEDSVRIVVDQFGDPSHVRRNLGPAARRAAFTMRTGGESNPAVAAASFLARAAFLRGFDEVRNLSGDDALPRGASDPRIVPAARRLLREGGEAWLGKFAKLHFRVTQQARA
jgi:ribonuclease HIII